MGIYEIKESRYYHIDAANETEANETFNEGTEDDLLGWKVDSDVEDIVEITKEG